MKVHIERKALADTIAWIAQAIPKNPPMPALAGIRLSAAGGYLTARSFDYDVSHSARIEAEIASEGECLISGRFLNWITGSLKGADVELVLDNDELTVSSGRSSYRARTLRIDDYPKLPAQPKRVGAADASTLAEAVTAADLFIDANASLAVLQGISLSGDQAALTVVGMCRQGANVATVDWECAEAFSVIPLPRQLTAALRGLSGTVTIGCEGGVLGLADDRRAVTLRTIDDAFPNWRSLLRSEDEDAFGVTVDGGELAEAVKRAGALCDDETPLVLRIGSNEIAIEIAAAERGSGSDVVAAECGGEQVMGMHARYLLAGLGAMPAGPVRLGVGTPNTNGRLGSLNVRPSETDDRLAFVMPKRLPGGIA